MKPHSLTLLISTIFVTLLIPKASALDILDTERSDIFFNGYSRFGIGGNGTGGYQDTFMIPEARSKYRLGNEGDDYSELTLRYNMLMGADATKSMDVIWTTALSCEYGMEQEIGLTYAAELYFKFYNLFGNDESLWIGRRYYDRKYIDMLDRYWLNSGQDGFGIGIENLINNGSGQDLKIAFISFADRDMDLYESNSTDYTIFNYTADVRWEGLKVSEYSDINFAVNYTLRPQNETLGYECRHGLGLFAWLDHEHGDVTNYTAFSYRWGANVMANNGAGRAIKENQFNDRRIITDLRNTKFFELSNNFTYDNAHTYALDAVALVAMQDFGTDPYWLNEDGTKDYYNDLGSNFYWFTLAARNIFYLTDIFRINVELSTEYSIVEHLNADGFLNKFTFMPELSTGRSIGKRPVLRPYVSYAVWSETLRGYIGSDSFLDQRHGFVYGIQFDTNW